ncbi:MAG: ABC transporter permease, partial [Spirochaetaceae bacterium]|nr:ABC transporter permease [Spirochaetaceae bacterium]
MFHRIIRNDIRKSPLASLATLLFVAASGLLVSLAGTLAVEVAGAIEALMEASATPHLLQMHSGPIDLPRLEAFAAARPEVERFQVLEFLNADGADFELGGRSLSGSVQDNGLAVQGGDFDFLLDLGGRPIMALPGELYVPLCYRKDGSARLGDRARILGRDFRIAGWVRDSQMNSTLSSSKRFIVNEADYAALRGLGSVEYLVEFRLHDPKRLGEVEAAYVAAGLEANGPRVSQPLFRLMNAMSDGLMIAVLLLAGGLVTAVALLCIRLTLLAKIEEDRREIGAMRAIGLRVSDIRRAYLAKYAVLSGAGSLLGFTLSLLLRGPLLANLRLFMGEGGKSALAPAIGLCGASLVSLAVLAYVRGLLGRFRRISPAEALRSGAAREAPRAGRLRLAAGGPPGLEAALGVNTLLGFKDVLSRKRLYGTMLAVLVVSAFIALVPRNLHTTVSSPGFCAYLGIGRCDLRADIQGVDGIAERAAELAAAMGADPAIKRRVVLTARAYTVRGADGAEAILKVESGDHGVFPVAYAKGGAPASREEIALSAMSAEDLGKGIGDGLELSDGTRRRRLVVSGIYSDVTNGGKTAKASFEDGAAPVMWSTIGAELAEPAKAGSLAAAYAARFPFAKISSVEEYVAQTFGPTIRAIGAASLVSFAVALALAALIALLFTRMLVARDR